MVDVIIPCFNTGRYLRDAIDSALGQTYRPINILVVDDGSTDDTREIVESYGGRVGYFYQENKGLPAARNAGLVRTNGEFVCLLDADDVILPHMIEEQVSLLSQDDRADICHGKTLSFIDDDITHPLAETWRPHAYWYDYLEPFSVICAIHLGSSILRRKCFERVGLFREMTERGCEDWAFWLSCALAGEVFVHVPRVHGLYRVHGESMSSREEAIAAREAELMRLAVSLFDEHRVIDPRKRSILSCGIKRVSLRWLDLNRRERFEELVQLSRCVFPVSEAPDPIEPFFSTDRAYPVSILYLVLSHRFFDLGLEPLAAAMFINCGYVLKLRDEASHHDVLELFDSVVERLSFLRAEESDHAERSEKQGLDLQESSFFDRLELVVPHEASCYSYVKHQLALLDESRGFVDKAVEGLRAAVQLNPNYSYAHFDLGRALLEQRNYQEAVQALSRSVELDPNYSFAQFDLGRVLMEQGNYEAAEQALSRSIELDPNYSFAQFDLGRALMRLGNHRKAERVLRRSIELNPAFAPARLEYVTACAKMGKMRPAIAAFVASCRIDPDLSADYLVREMEGLAQRLLANTWGSLKKLSLFVMASTVVSRLIRYLIRCGVKVRPR